MKFCNSNLTRNIFNLNMRRFFFGLVYVWYFINILVQTIPYFFYNFIGFIGTVLYKGIRVIQVLEELPVMKRILICCFF